MSYKELKLRANTPESASTEIMYEIATCRHSGIDLIRINISYDGDEGNNTENKRIISSLIRILKNMKQKGSVQFFATADSFKLGTTEAVFLQNKYPDLLAAEPKEENGAFIYVKI